MNWFQELTDILRCKILQLTGQINYPLSILPKKCYVSRMNIDAICEKIPLVVVRRSEKIKEETLDKFGNPRQDSIDGKILPKDIPNMSMNLLGGKFKSNHIQFNPTGEAAQVWDGQEYIQYSKYASSVQELLEAIPIFFNLEKLHNIVFPYQRAKDKDLNKFITALNINPPEKEGKYEFQVKTKISHKPTRLNYWHVEFQLTDILQNKLISDIKSAWKISAAEIALQQIISANASINCREIKGIPTSYFHENF